MFSTPLIQRIRLIHFRIYRDARFELGQKLHIITGPNGVGKTNLLDALYYACFTRSYFAGQDNLVFAFDADFFRIEVYITQGNDKHEIEIKNVKQGKKEVWLDGVPVEKLSELIGRFPAVFVTPDDNQLLLGSSELRRKLIDATLCQTDTGYLNHLILYNKLLAQRNALLKSFAERGRVDYQLLETYDEKLIPAGEAIFRERERFCEQYKELFSRFYSGIFQGDEQVSITFNSCLLNSNYKDLMIQNRNADLAAQRTTAGIHTDDLGFELNGFPVKKTGSQGQQKTFLLALKLAQYAYISQVREVRPFLFLDDIFDKLDRQRTAQLINLVTGDDFGQVFITDTDKDRIQHILDENGIGQYQHIELPHAQ